MCVAAAASAAALRSLLLLPKPLATAARAEPSRAATLLCTRARSRSLGCFGCAARSRCLRFNILLLFSLLLLFLLLCLLLLLSIRLRPHLPACLGCPASVPFLCKRALSLSLSVSGSLSLSLALLLALSHTLTLLLPLSQSASLPASLLLLSFAQRIGL